MSGCFRSIAGLFVVALALAGCTRDLPVTDADREVVLRAADLVPYGYGLQKTEPYESFKHIRYADGSHELTYEYGTPEAEEENALYINVVVSVEQGTSDAWTSHNAQEIGLKVGLKANGVEQRELKDFYRYGDASSFFLLELKGKPIGNVFTVRDGKRVFVFTLSGMFFRDAATFQELIEPRLKKFSAYDPT